MPDHAAAGLNRLYGCGIEQGGKENGVEQVINILELYFRTTTWVPCIFYLYPECGYGSEPGYLYKSLPR